MIIAATLFPTYQFRGNCSNEGLHYVIYKKNLHADWHVCNYTDLVLCNIAGELEHKMLKLELYNRQEQSYHISLLSRLSMGVSPMEFINNKFKKLEDHENRARSVSEKIGAIL